MNFIETYVLFQFNYDNDILKKLLKKYKIEFFKNYKK